IWLSLVSQTIAKSEVYPRRQHSNVPASPASSPTTDSKVMSPPSFISCSFNSFKANKLPAKPPFMSAVPLPILFPFSIFCSQGFETQRSDESTSTTSICPFNNKLLCVLASDPFCTPTTLSSPGYSSH